MVDQDSDRRVVSAIVRAHAELIVTENRAGVAAVCGEDGPERLPDSGPWLAGIAVDDA